jgi:hypothetical protein
MMSGPPLTACAVVITSRLVRMRAGSSFVHLRQASGVLVHLMARYAATTAVSMTVKDVLADRGINGTGQSSP